MCATRGGRTWLGSHQRKEAKASCFEIAYLGADGRNEY